MKCSGDKDDLRFPGIYGINGSMEYAFKERIGKPELFTGRKEELAFFLKWIDDIKDEKSQSTALLARRKMSSLNPLSRMTRAMASTKGVTKRRVTRPFMVLSEGDMRG